MNVLVLNCHHVVANVKEKLDLGKDALHMEILIDLEKQSR